MINSYELRFFRVGAASKGGDAILLRIIDEYRNSKVVVIDGGYKETGDAIISYLSLIGITTIDLVINTHPDIDHISGLIRLFEEDSLTISKLIMNRPWRDSNIKAGYFEDGRITDNSVNKRMTEAFKYAYKLEQVAIQKIGEGNIIHPVVGNTYFDCLTILAPSTQLYRSKLLESDKTPTTVNDSSTATFSGTMRKLVRYFKGLMVLLWKDEETSPINETSIVTLLCLPDRNYLLTADAGRTCLDEALKYKSGNVSISYKPIHVLQLPHHGSRKNISPTLIERIGASDYIISCPPKGLETHHPSRRMVNMVLEKKPLARIFSTADCSSFIFHYNLPIQATPQAPMVSFDLIESD